MSFASNMVRFAVVGKPATKGSWKIRNRRGKQWLQADNESERPWADAVAWHAKQAMSRMAMFEFGVSVELYFTMSRPKKPANDYPTGDVDKLARSCLDAMTAIVWRDDSQVESLNVTKAYAIEGVSPGVIVTVSGRPGAR